MSIPLIVSFCMRYLDDDVHEEHIEQFNCAKKVLNILANYGPRDSLIIEFIGIISESSTALIFTEALHCLQVLLLRLEDNKPEAFLYALSSIPAKLQKLGLPLYIEDGYDKKQQELLEQDADVQKLLTYYVKVCLFYKPILEDILKKDITLMFRDCGLTRKVIMSCFLLQLLGSPLALLDISLQSEKTTNMYTKQIVKDICDSLLLLFKGDYFFMLQFAEKRVRFQNSNWNVVDCNNMYTIESYVPIISMAMFYYMLFVDLKVLNQTQNQVPLVYDVKYLFKANVYLSFALLKSDMAMFQFRGVKLMEALLALLKERNIKIAARDLNIAIHTQFCALLARIVSYTEYFELAKVGVQVLKTYVLQFEDEGCHIMFKILFSRIKYSGLSGYLCTLYKNFIDEIMKKVPKDKRLPYFCCGEQFKDLCLTYFFTLPSNVETDLYYYSDIIRSSLNFIRYLVGCDKNNRTGFWNFTADIENKFLNPLRIVLDMKVAHYKQDLLSVMNESDTLDKVQKASLKILNPHIANAKKLTQKTLDLDERIKFLKQYICLFDLMDFNLARTYEVLLNTQKLRKEENQKELYVNKYTSKE